MDLNYLYQRRGQSLFMAATASCERSRAAHIALSLGYVARIDAVRQANAAAVTK